MLNFIYGGEKLMAITVYPALAFIKARALSMRYGYACVHCGPYAYVFVKGEWIQ